jgi:hypothetical protein
VIEDFRKLAQRGVTSFAAIYREMACGLISKEPSHLRVFGKRAYCGVIHQVFVKLKGKPLPCFGKQVLHSYYIVFTHSDILDGPDFQTTGRLK